MSGGNPNWSVAGTISGIYMSSGGPYSWNPPKVKCVVCNEELPFGSGTEIVLKRKRILICNECLKDIIGKEKLDKLDIATEL